MATRSRMILFAAVLFLCCLLVGERYGDGGKRHPTSVPTPPLVVTPLTLSEAPPVLEPNIIDALSNEPPASCSHTELLAKIEDAKKQLRYAKMPNRKIGGDNAVLALWNPEHRGPVKLVLLQNGVCKTPGCAISVVVPNGVNTQYRVASPSGSVVIALKTNVKHAKRKGAVEEAVYVPYSPALRNRETVDAGRCYLNDLVQRGKSRIDALDVRSLVDEKLRPTDTVPSAILATLLVVEHIDPDDFDRDGVEAVVGKVLTILATNREDSYRYAVSYAKARGLAQFIESTYQITRDRYPKAQLPKDFVEGMTNHEHAVCAQYCLADWSITRLTPELRAKLRKAGNEENLGAFLAAAYNGGEDKAARAMAADPANWEKAGHGLFPQTVKYVEIFRATYRFLHRR